MISYRRVRRSLLSAARMSWKKTVVLVVLCLLASVARADDEEEHIEENEEEGVEDSNVPACEEPDGSPPTPVGPCGGRGIIKVPCLEGFISVDGSCKFKW